MISHLTLWCSSRRRLLRLARDARDAQRAAEDVAGAVLADNTTLERRIGVLEEDARMWEEIAR